MHICVQAGHNRYCDAWSQSLLLCGRNTGSQAHLKRIPKYRVWPRSWLARGVFWFLGFPGELLSNLSTATRRPVFEALRIPAHIRRLNYLAAPLSGALQESVRGRYAELAPLGPNDGVTLLSDAFQREGVTIVELQLDHYFKDSDIHFKTQALAWLVLEVAIEENSNKFSPPWPPSIRNQDQGREYAN